MSQFLLKGDEDQSDIPHVSVGKIIFESLKQHGDRIAIVDPEFNQNSTFTEILTRSSKLAQTLRRQGLKRNDIVVIISTFNVDFFVAYTACLFNGFTAYLLNPDFTKYELKQYLDQTDARFVFSCEKSLKNILDLQQDYPNIESVLVLSPTVETEALTIDSLIKGEIINDFEPEDFDPEATNAAIIFSSGTTGFPKGVCLNHRNLRMGLVQFCTYYSNTDGNDTLISVAPVYHVAGILMYINVVYVGIKAIGFAKFLPDVYLKSIQQYKVTITFVVPQLMHFLAFSPIVGKFDLSSLRYMLFGSSPSSKTVLKVLQEKFTNLCLVHVYGLTETTGLVFYNRSKRKIESVGFLLPNNEAKIVDPQTGESLGPNTTGELYIKGDCVVKKYYKSILQESFDSDGFLRTGDAAYYDEENYMYIVDRIKNIIKYKGFQVSPVEIESVLNLHPAVADVGVIGVPDERAGELPCALIVKKSGVDVTEKEIYDFVAERLNPQKHLRGGIIFVNEIPKNSMMKHDRKALKTMWQQLQLIR